MRLMLRIQAAVGVLICGLFLSGCNRLPTDPSQSATAASATLSDAESRPTTQQSSRSIEDLESRGWDCRPVPLNPIVETCSHPNQLHPVLLPGPPPPPDRPAAITLHVFENGVFVGTSLLIRSDLYNGQRCRSTEDLYRFIPRIGYYECVHRSQAS
jgi:hypothetical protein